MKRLITALAIALAATGCANIAKPDGTTQTKVDVVGAIQFWEAFAKRSTALEVEFLDENTTEKRRAEIRAQRQVERAMLEAALEVAMKIKPVIEIRIVAESGIPSP